MKLAIALCVAGVAGALAGCGAGRQDRMEHIQVSSDGSGFVGADSGKPFRPMGFNYDHDSQSRLIEDYWDDEWPTVAEDFREMKALGANVVRIHLQVARFLEGPQKTGEKALENLGRLVKLAEETGLYLDLTGLGCYRRKDVPPWYDALDERGRWAAQARFWAAVSARCADSPAVFCYDLMNEPVVPGPPRGAGEWLAGEFGGFSFVQFITLDRGTRPRIDVAREWVSTLAAAIRRHDRRHMITVGLMPNSHDGPGITSGFLPQRLTDQLDFICVHIYPDRKRLDEDLKTLQRFRTARPLVIEEVFPLNCSADDLERFLRAARPWTAGWLGFYWGRTPEELRRSRQIGDAMLLGSLEMFQRLSRQE